MFTINNYHYNCNKQCQNTAHGSKILQGFGKTEISDEKLAAYIGKCCRNFARVVDVKGQSALHLAASTNRYAIAEWLINQGANVNLKDKCTGQTPLHFALFNANISITVLLHKYGANLYNVDIDNVDPLQLCYQESTGLDNITYPMQDLNMNDVLVWGKNSNYNLGIENREDCVHPQYIDRFKANNTAIKSISIGIYHSMFVDAKECTLYVVGHGKGGRLGTGNTNTLVLPQKVKLPSQKSIVNILSISAGRNHSLILIITNKRERYKIYGTGLNEYGQLGFNENTVYEFREVKNPDEIGLENFKGVIALDYYSIAYSTDSVYVWGINGGQLGVKTDKNILKGIRLITNEHRIYHVAANRAAIACIPQTKDKLLIYHNFKRKTIRLPSKYQIFAQICLIGGSFNTDSSISNIPKTNENLFIFAVTDSPMEFYMYNDEVQLLFKCVYRANFNNITSVTSGKNGIILLADRYLYCESYRQIIPVKEYKESDFREVRGTSQTSNTSLHEMYSMQFTRIPRLDRLENFWCDPDGTSFACLQESSKQHQKLDMFYKKHLISFKNLLLEATEFDDVHDILFHVDDEIFPAHKYIIFSRSPGLATIVRESPCKNIRLNKERLSAKMFGLILKYIYTNHRLSLDDIEDIENSLGPCTGLINYEIFTIFREYCGEFGIPEFADSHSKVPPRMRFKRLNFPELYDVSIRCANGIVLKAHKCVLVSRLEYFNMMFNNSWAESNNINLSTIPVEYMDVIINYLYINSDSQLLNDSHFSESYIYNMLVICDQYFINQLQNIFEYLLSNRMSVRKCGEMLQFACDYNCKALERSCHSFICQNMARILEHNTLDDLGVDVLERINTAYKEWSDMNGDNWNFPCDLNELTDSKFEDFIKDFEVDLTRIRGTEDEQGSKIKQSKIVGKTRKSLSKKGIVPKSSRSLSESEEIAVESIPTKSTDGFITDDDKHILNDLVNKTKEWTIVAEKKEAKNKSILAVLNVNEILKAETKKLDELINLKELNEQSAKVTSPKMIQCDQQTDEAVGYVVNFGDFTPLKGGKLSQKQRKRLASESKCDNFVNVPSPTQLPSPSPSKVDPVKNPWGDVSSGTIDESFASIMKSPDLRRNDKKSPVSQPINIPGSSSQHNFIDKQSPSKVGSFSKILIDERRQMDYFKKMKSKSLALTQLEETAIDELEKFYNVENVFDESIRIERCRTVEPTLNFAVWEHK